MNPLEALKLKHKPVPLSVFIYIYAKADEECYPQYMKGATLLLSYLTSDGTVPLLLPPKAPTSTHLPNYLRTYELNQLAKLITPRTPSISMQAYINQLNINEVRIYTILHEVYSNGQTQESKNSL